MKQDIKISFQKDDEPENTPTYERWSLVRKKILEGKKISMKEPLSEEKLMEDCFMISDLIVSNTQNDCPSIYCEIKDIWKLDIANTIQTIQYYNSMVEEFTEGIEKCVDVQRKIELELENLKHRTPEDRRFIDKRIYHYIELGYMRAIQGKDLSFKDYLIYVFWDRLKGEIDTNRLASYIEVAEYQFAFVAQGYANAKFEKFLNEKLQELKVSGGDATGEEITGIDMVAHFVILLNELGVLQKIREEHPRADLNKLLGKIFRADVKEQTNIRKTIAKVLVRDTKTLNKRALKAVRKHLLECDIDLHGLKFND